MVSGWLVSRVRRGIEVALSAVGLAVLSPVLGVLAVIIRSTMGRPVFFVHRRAGKDGEPFDMIKLRSMTPEYDENGVFVEDHDRVTPVGRFIRKTSLDEIPELINVIRGDMSLIGPRPLLLEYVGRYSPTQAERLKVRPGLTGLAQVSGRNALSWDKRFDLDREYIRTASPRLDVAILLRTVAKVVRRSDTSAEGYVSAPKFMGTDAA